MVNEIINKILLDGTKVRVYKLKDYDKGSVLRWALYDDGGKTRFADKEFKP